MPTHHAMALWMDCQGDVKKTHGVTFNVVFCQMDCGSSNTRNTSVELAQKSTRNCPSNLLPVLFAPCSILTTNCRIQDNRIVSILRVIKHMQFSLIVKFCALTHHPGMQTVNGLDAQRLSVDLCHVTQCLVRKRSMTLCQLSHAMTSRIKRSGVCWCFCGVLCVTHVRSPNSQGCCVVHA